MLQVIADKRPSIKTVINNDQENQLRETLELLTKIDGPIISPSRLIEIKVEIRRCEREIIKSQKKQHKMYLSISTVLIATLFLLGYRLFTSDPSLALKFVTSASVVYIVILLIHIFKVLKAKQERVDFTKEVLEQYVNAKLLLYDRK